ncbi:unnamed protein product [Tuber melanosporum]|uniref:(Perigord truffle) hypothetical protein n=1 Tax=Tuber melanosporum (strain Mel28) TaxID=656061 RepID=D5GFS9_TUBMM|nr:uncharacterized protein GSTUM_00007058001 [Tuber melanosporum]CAZ83372.1 unnamed protein product [Tuber melanosporum]
MSFCSSPASQRSSFSSTCSIDCTSPNTAVTTPSSTGATSPKLGQSYTNTQPPSPDAPDISYPYNPTSPIPMNEYPPSSVPPSYAYSCSNQIPSPSPFTYNTTPPPLSASPSNYGYPGYSNYMPESPLQPSPYVHLRSPTPLPSMDSSGSSSMGGGGGFTAASPRKYSGYPPASAFYGPMPNPPAHSASPSSSRYRRKRSETINPEEYKSESWYTADGTKVECSAMHLQCATM